MLYKWSPKRRMKCVWSEQRPPDTKDCLNVKGRDSVLCWQPVAQIVFVSVCVCQCVSVSDCFTLCLRLFMWAKRWSELSGYFMSSLPRWLQIKEWHQQRAPLETDVLYSNGVLCVFLCVCVHLPNVFWMTVILFFRKSHCICHFSKLTALQMNSSYLNQSRRNLTDKYVS